MKGALLYFKNGALLDIFGNVRSYIEVLGCKILRKMKSAGIYILNLRTKVNRWTNGFSNIFAIIVKFEYDTIILFDNALFFIGVVGRKILQTMQSGDIFLTQ